MTITEAKKILGDRAEWELIHMVKALSMLSLLNTDEENQRLEAGKVMLRDMRKRARVGRRKK